MNTGSLVWVRNPHPRNELEDDVPMWIPSTVESRVAGDYPNSYSLVVNLHGKKTYVSMDKTSLENDYIKQRHPLLNAFQDDILDIPYLNEPEVLLFLKTRYERGYIYTYSGSVLVVLNPLDQVQVAGDDANLIRVFTKDIIEECTTSYISAQMSSEGMNVPTPNKIIKHTILISGESGSVPMP
eukprot:scaffold1498_cov180-Ochromonas_danica.AAC.31